MESANGENGDENEDNTTAEMNKAPESPACSHAAGQLVEPADFAINGHQPPNDSVNHGLESPVRKVGKLEIMVGGQYPSAGAAAMNNSSPRLHQQGYCRARRLLKDDKVLSL